MASQMNPVISAFLQARQQADERGRVMLQQQMMQQRLEQEAEADKMMNDYRVSQLQQQALTESNRAREAAAANKTRQLQAQITGLGNVTTGIKENIYGPEAVQEILSMLEASPAILTGIKNYEQRQVEERAAQLAKINELAEAEANAAGAITGAQEKAKNPFREKDQQFKLNLANITQIGREKLQEDAQVHAVDLQDKRLSAQERMTNQKVSASLAKQKTAKTGIEKMSAGAQDKFKANIDVLETLKEVSKMMNEPEYASYFVGPGNAQVRDLTRKVLFGKFGSTLPAKHAEMKSILGRTKAKIVNPIFGASFTTGEANLANAFTLAESGSMTLDEVKGTIDALEGLLRRDLDLSKQMYGANYKEFIGNNVDKNEAVDQEQLKKARKLLGR